MGDGENTPLQLKFDPRIRLEFRGAAITSDDCGCCSGVTLLLASRSCTGLLPSCTSIRFGEK